MIYLWLVLGYSIGFLVGLFRGIWWANRRESKP